MAYARCDNSVGFFLFVFENLVDSNGIGFRKVFTIYLNGKKKQIFGVYLEMKSFANKCEIISNKIPINFIFTKKKNLL